MKSFYSNIKILVFTFLTLLLINKVEAQSIVINEMMSSNINTIFDEDGDYPDWIEIYNNDSININLENFGLSDDFNEPYKWIFSEVILEPDEFLVLFASGKDKRNWIKHWETIINWGDDWKYNLGASEPHSNWKGLDFDDSSLNINPSGFGYGDCDDTTIVSSTVSLFHYLKYFTSTTSSS
jgi:hypothetical protein